MTTIVASTEPSPVMVCDSRFTQGDRKWRGRKVFRIGDALYGIAGTYDAEWHKLLAYVKNSGQPKPNMEELEVLVLNKEGLWSLDLKAQMFPLGVTCSAIGSGGATALGAMGAGASIERAVRIACGIDSYSEGPVRTHWL